MLKTMIFLLLSLPAWAAEKTYTSEGQKFAVETLVEHSEPVWGVDFLPEGKVIFTERHGKMFIYEGPKKVTEISGVPKVQVEGQGGLLDVRVHPEFAKNKLVYITYSEPVGKKNTTALGVGKLENNKLIEFKKLFSADKPNNNSHHFGSRIEFDGKGHIFITVGDRGERHQAQDLSDHLGSVLRLKEDGTAPTDNPFINQKGAKTEIWSYGHRSPQGLTRHPETNELWLVEMGPRGGDEVNVIKAGKNYGWPVVTYGSEYYGPKIGVKEKAGMEQPLVYWVPSISPSGADFYFGDKFPKWKGNLFLACLSGQHLRRISFEGQKPSKQEELLKDLDYRFRQVRRGPDGLIYLGTDEGKLLRLVPR